jgi:hypothetical protein
MKSTDAQNRFAEAKQLYSRGEHRAALSLLDTLAATYPGAKNIELARAECLIKLGDLPAAAESCARVLARHADARAARLLEKCRAAEIESGFDAVAGPVSEAFKPLPAPRSHHRHTYTLTTLVVVGAALAGIARIVAHEISTPEDYVEGFTAKELRRIEEPLKRPAPSPSAATAQTVTRKAENEIPVIPREEWNVNEAGVPAWRHGMYRQITIPGSWFEPWNGPRTIDVFIPAAYESSPDEQFPTLTISMPELNPGFLGLETWADRKSVILVAMNTSGNRWHSAGNREAQLAAYNFLSGHLRWHPYLNFTVGTSGGAQMGWIAAANSPDMFAGVLMIAHGGYREMILAPHIRIAYLHGTGDWNANFVREMIGRMQRNGNQIRHQTFPGGHETGPLNLRVQLLDWLLDSSRRDLGQQAQSF